MFNTIKKQLGVIAVLSVIFGLQIAAFAVPMNACQNAVIWIEPKCEKDPRGQSECMYRKCDALYSGIIENIQCKTCADLAS